MRRAALDEIEKTIEKIAKYMHNFINDDTHFESIFKLPEKSSSRIDRVRDLLAKLNMKRSSFRIFSILCSSLKTEFYW